MLKNDRGFHLPEIFIGGRQNYDDSFFWVDGTNFNYENWVPEGGSFHGQKCIGFLISRDTEHPHHGKWTLVPCEAKTKYFCKKACK